MNSPSAITNQPNGASSTHELFALTDEQIIGIEPAAADDAVEVAQAFLPVPASAASMNESAIETNQQVPVDQSAATPQSAQAGVPVLPVTPPAWLARQMNDPWVGEEARELWDNALRSQNEAAEYRAAIATPAEAKSLKEIYPGGLDQARAAAERARALDEFDAAYFGGAGKSAQEVSAGRTALAQRMVQENPAAFREMVAAGVEALRQLEEVNVAPPFRVASPATTPVSNLSAAVAQQQDAGLKPGSTNANAASSPESDARVSAYAEFEKAANADLEKSVGSTIENALTKALPNLRAQQDRTTVGTRHVVPLRERLATAVRQEIETALQGDRQLGEQVAQVLASRRFDETTRAQVVRLINDRAQQLVPTATKRVLNDWTQTTLAAHRAKTDSQEAANISLPRSEHADQAPTQPASNRPVAKPPARPRDAVPRSPSPLMGRGHLDYKKLTDEQILDL